MDELDRLVARIAARQHGVFSTTQLPMATRSAIRTRTSNGRWRIVTQTIYVIEGAPDTWKQRVWLKLLIGGSGAVVGARAAIPLHHVRGLGYGPIDIVQPESTVPNAKARTSRRTTWLPAWQLTTAEGFPVVTIERALFDLAGLTSPVRRRNGWASMTERQVARLMDNAILQGLVTVNSLLRVHVSLAGRGRPGSRLMRELLRERSENYVPTDSDLEDAFVKLAANHGLPAPQRQVSLGSKEKHIGRVDFYYDEARLVVEADSRAFHGQKAQMRDDHQRELELLANGWQVLHVDWWQLTDDGPNVARLLRNVLERRSAG